METMILLMCFGLNQNMVKAIIKKESNFNVKAYKAGNYGLMQIRLGTSKSYCGITTEKQLMRPEQNIGCGCTILRSLLNKYKYEPDVLSAYNAGSPTYKNMGYVAKVGEFQKEYENKSTGVQD